IRLHYPLMFLPVYEPLISLVAARHGQVQGGLRISMASGVGQKRANSPHKVEGAELDLAPALGHPDTRTRAMPSGLAHKPARNVRVRIAVPGDLDALMELEHRVFATDRLSRRSLRHFL